MHVLLVVQFGTEPPRVEVFLYTRTRVESGRGPVDSITWSHGRTSFEHATRRQWTNATKSAARKVEIARALGTNPRKLPRPRPNPQQRWKLPVGEFNAQNPELEWFRDG